ncbi:MAG: glycosyl hydrolase [Bacteroidota bacterium]
MERYSTFLIGTSKGLVEVNCLGGKWQITTCHFVGFPVSYVFVDERSGTWWAALAHRHWGQKLHRSNDRGASWEAVSVPTYPQHARLKSGRPATLRKIWSMAHGGVDRPKVLYVGTEPGGLFVSEDGGDSFQLLESLWNHPSREHQWFGAGRDHPFIHSIVVDPRDSAHFYIAISCAGVFETWDGGKTWAPKNKGLIAAYLPNPHVEIGHDPHLLLACRAQPEVLWQQNHCGIFRSTNGGAYWENISGENDFPDYGFALAIEPNDPNIAWVIPVTDDTKRVAPNLALSVCQTTDGGKSWQRFSSGLPQEFCFDIVFRHSLVKRGKVLLFGTTTGNLYLSENGGEHWQTLSNHLARVEVVAATEPSY